MDIQAPHDELKIFDCNASLGRRHNERVSCDSKEALISFMSEAGISQSLVYNPYCMHWGTMEGNRFLLDTIGDAECLVPQFVVSLAVDDIDEVQKSVREAGIKSLRIFPNAHGYPLVPWIADVWFEWIVQERIPLWIPMGFSPQVDVRDLYDMASRHPDVTMVLAGSHYNNYSSIWPLLKARENIYFDLSRFDILDGVQRLKKHIGTHRLLFGSGLPDVDPRPYLYYLRHCGLAQSELQAICRNNLERILHRGSIV